MFTNNLENKLGDHMKNIMLQEFKVQLKSYCYSNCVMKSNDFETELLLFIEVYFCFSSLVIVDKMKRVFDDY